MEIQALIEGAHWLDRMSIFGTIGSLCGPKVLIEAQGTILAPISCRGRKPRCMTARAPIAHGGPQRLPAHRSVARQGTSPRTVPSMDSVDDPQPIQLKMKWR